MSGAGDAGNTGKRRYEEGDCHAYRLFQPIATRAARSAGSLCARDKKLAQVDRAEKLLAELDPSRTYSYEYLCYRVTDFRPESYPEDRLTGRHARHDLQLFIEDVSDAADVPAEAAPEPVLTVDQLSERFKVSTKTISRWRRQGLVSRRFVFDGRKRVGFLKSSVDRFVSGNEERVKRGSRFSQLTADDRAEIVVASPATGRGRRLPGRGCARVSPSGWAAAWKRFATR